MPIAIDDVDELQCACGKTPRAWPKIHDHTEEPKDDKQNKGNRGQLGQVYLACADWRPFKGGGCGYFRWPAKSEKVSWSQFKMPRQDGTAAGPPPGVDFLPGPSRAPSGAEVAAKAKAGPLGTRRLPGPQQPGKTRDIPWLKKRTHGQMPDPGDVVAGMQVGKPPKLRRRMRRGQTDADPDYEDDRNLLKEMTKLDLPGTKGQGSHFPKPFPFPLGTVEGAGPNASKRARSTGASDSTTSPGTTSSGSSSSGPSQLALPIPRRYVHSEIIKVEDDDSDRTSTPATRPMVWTPEAIPVESDSGGQ